jgi:hypothetical protein
VALCQCAAKTLLDAPVSAPANAQSQESARQQSVPSERCNEKPGSASHTLSPAASGMCAMNSTDMLVRASAMGVPKVTRELEKPTHSCELLAASRTVVPLLQRVQLADRGRSL